VLVVTGDLVLQEQQAEQEEPVAALEMALPEMQEQMVDQAVAVAVEQMAPQVLVEQVLLVRNFPLRRVELLARGGAVGVVVVHILRLSLLQEQVLRVVFTVVAVVAVGVCRMARLVTAVTEPTAQLLLLTRSLLQYLENF
jgi:hypothetical protein